MRVKVHHTLELLEADMREIVRKAPRELNGLIREGIKVGNSVAKDFARKSSGRHGKLYPRSFSTNMNRPAHFSGLVSIYSGEYGPDISMPQGGMSFEGGSRQQKPHLDLARSSDIIGPALAGEVRRTVGGWFW